MHQFTLVLPDVFNVKMRHILNCSRIYVHHIHQMPFCYCTLFQWYELCMYFKKTFWSRIWFFMWFVRKFHSWVNKSKVFNIYRCHQIAKAWYLRHYKRLDSIVILALMKLLWWKQMKDFVFQNFFFQTKLRKVLG